MIITHNGTILKHDGTILTKITEVPPQPPFTNTYSLQLDGIDDYVATSGVYSELDGLTNTAFSFWMKTSNTAGVRIVLSIGTPSGDYRAAQFQIWSQNGAIRIYYNGLSYSAASNSVISNDVWEHVLVTRDSSRAIGDKVRIYINGVDETSSDSTRYLGTASAADTGLFIGEHPNGYASPFLGNIDEVAIYNQDMASYISEIYSVNGAVDLNNLDTVPQPIDWYRNGDNGSWKSPQWLIPNNENFAANKVSNYSFELDGIDDYVDCGNSSSLNFDADNAFSISVWFKRQSNANAVAVVDKSLGAPNYSGYMFFIFNNKVYFRIRENSSLQHQINNNNTHPFNTWVHYVVTYDGSRAGSAGGLNLYQDGVLQTSVTRTGNFATGTAQTSANFSIGSQESTLSLNFSGGLDEPSVFNSELSASQILNIYNGGEPTTIIGAVAHWRMGEDANFTSNWLVDNSISPNRALKFDNTYVTSPPWSGYQGLRASTTAISSNHITLSTWFKSTDSGNGQGQIFKTSLWDIKVYGNRVYLSKVSALYRYWNSSDLFNGSWHNIIIYIPNTTTWNLADAKIYVDGVDLGVGTGIGDGTGVSQITDIYGLFKTGGGGGGTMTAEISNWSYWLSDKRDDVSTI